MNNDITAEEVYALYHKETFLAQGKQTRPVKNFDKAKEKDTWKYFEKCAGFVNRNRGHVDLHLYIKSIAKDFSGWFDPKILGSIKATQIYKAYLAELEQHSSPTKIKNSVLRSIKFVVTYCDARGLKNFGEYLSEGLELIPTLCKHYSAGSISPYFLAAIQDIDMLLASYPPDCRYDYLKGFFESYNLYRIRVVSNKELETVLPRVEELIQLMIEKRQK